MTRPSDLVTFQVYEPFTSSYTDYSDGLINIVIERGQQEYTGPFSFPDTGTATIVSRNPNLDPYKNSLVRYNSEVIIRSATQRMFTGYIEGINVEYQPAGDPPIITIKMIDIIGVLAKHVLSEDFITSQVNWTTLELLTALPSEVPQFSTANIVVDGTEYANGPIELGTTALEALQSRVKTDFGMLIPDRNGIVTYYRQDISNPSHPANINSIIDFKYDGTGSSYKTINLSDGFSKVVNDLELNGLNNTQVVVNNINSINSWGKSSATIDLITDDTGTIQTIANAALLELSEPQREITQITFDGLKAYYTGSVAYSENVARFLTPYGSNVSVEHIVDENFTIDRKYQVVGIRHEIDYNNWYTTLALKNAFYVSTATVNPIIVRTPTTGTQDTVFTYSYTYPFMNEVLSVEWDADDGFTGTGSTITVDYATGGTKTVTFTLNTIYGYAKTVTVLFYVGDALPTSSFTYTVDALNYYQFTFTGSGATSVLWNFGDGRQSTEFNPKHYYLADNIAATITCTATNYVGSVVSTQTFSVNRIVNVPVKYAKLTFKSNGTWNTDTDWQNEKNYPYGYMAPYQFNWIETLNMSKDTTYNPADIPDWTVLNYKEFGGTFVKDLTLDGYGRLQKLPYLDTMNYLRPGNSGKVYPWCYGMGTDRVVEVTLQFDEYTDNFRGVWFAGQGGTNQGECVVDVSYDGNTWYRLQTATLVFSGTGGTTGYTAIPANAPATWFNTVVTYPSETLVRYIKVVYETPTSSTQSDYWINELVAVGPECTVNKGTYNQYTGPSTFYATNKPVTNAFGWGGVDLDRNQGAQLTFQYTPGNPPGINFNDPSTGYVSWISFAITGYQATGTITPYLNYKTKTDWNIIYRNSSQDVATIIDFQQNKRDVSGIYLDFRYTNLVYNSSHKISVYWSTDGVNWNTMVTNAEIKPTGQYGTLYVKTTPVTVGGVTYSPPITSGSTFVVEYGTAANSY
jgi:hypothetical protein